MTMDTAPHPDGLRSAKSLVLTWRFRILRDQLARLAEPHTRGCWPGLENLNELMRRDLYGHEGTKRLKWPKLCLFGAEIKYVALVRIDPSSKPRMGSCNLYLFNKRALLRCEHQPLMAPPRFADIGHGMSVICFDRIYINSECLFGAKANFSPLILLEADQLEPTVWVVLRSQLAAHRLGRAGHRPYYNAQRRCDPAKRYRQQGCGINFIRGERFTLVDSQGGSKDYVNRQVSTELIRRARSRNATMKGAAQSGTLPRYFLARTGR
jgi:hypothetical protein